MKHLSRYIPESKLDDDLIFHAGDILICEMEQNPLPHEIGMKGKDNMRDYSYFEDNGFYYEYLNLLRIKLGKVMDLQHGSIRTLSTPRNLFAKLETIRIEYEDELAFARFHARYKCIMQQ